MSGFWSWLTGQESEIDEQYDKGLVFHEEESNTTWGYRGSLDEEGLELLEQEGYTIIEDNRGWLRRLWEGNSQ